MPNISTSKFKNPLDSLYMCSLGFLMFHTIFFHTINITTTHQSAGPLSPSSPACGRRAALPRPSCRPNYNNISCFFFNINILQMSCDPHFTHLYRRDPRMPLYRPTIWNIEKRTSWLNIFTIASTDDGPLVFSTTADTVQATMMHQYAM